MPGKVTHSNSVVLFYSSDSAKPIPYNQGRCQSSGGDNGKPKQRASAASCGAARSAVARREVRPSDFYDRVAKWFRHIPEHQPTEANYIRSFAAENGAGAKSEMGEGW